MFLSIVSTLYRSEPYLAEFHRRAAAAALALSSDFEIILVNDGSPDGSLAAAVEISARDPRLTVVDLSRNFGHHQALRAGLELASGDYVFLVDSDLEEPPELLGEFMERLTREGGDLVYGYQPVRAGSWFRRLSGSVHFGLVNALGNPPIPKNVLMVRLMTKRFADALRAHRERLIPFSFLCALVGFRQIGVPVARSWKDGTSYSLRRRFALLFETITASGDLLLHVGVWIGAAEIALGCLILFAPWPPKTDIWASAVSAASVALGVATLLLGFLARCLGSVLLEVKKRPSVVIRGVYDSAAVSAQDGPEPADRMG